MTGVPKRPRIARRRFLAGLAASGLVAAGRGKAAARSEPPAFFVAGYGVGSAYRGGRPVAEDSELARALPSGYDGTVTMMTRVGPAAGETVRALFPLRGHQILVSPDRATVLFVGMNDRGMILADAGSLDLLARAAPHDETALFGGHACAAADGGVIFVAERRAIDRPFSGRPDDHFGAITVRDPRSLAVIERFDSFGIAPHEVVLMADGRHLAVANYGSTGWPADMAGAFPGLPHGVEPSVTVIDSRSGRLAAKVVGPDPRQEMRHLAALSGDRIAAVPVRPTTFGDGQRARSGLTEVYEPDRSDRQGRGYLPVPLMHISLTDGRSEVRRALADPPLSLIIFYRLIFNLYQLWMSCLFNVLRNLFFASNVYR